MRRIVLALLVAVVGSARFASGAAISVAGAECGTDQLLGLPFSATGNAGTTLCPDVAVGSVLDSSGQPLYGNPITSIQFTLVSGSVDTLTTDPNSELPDLTRTGSTFLLSGRNGIQVGCLLTTGDFQTCINDVVIRFTNTIGLSDDAAFKVTAVNDSVVPEPATGALLLSGLGAALVRRVRRRRT